MLQTFANTVPGEADTSMSGFNYLYKPKKNVEPLVELRKAFNDGQPALATGSTSYDAPDNRLLIRNNSPWDVVIFYSKDESNLQTPLVPAGNDTLLVYEVNGMNVDFTAGRGWNKRLIKNMMLPDNSKPARIWPMKGWFSEQPGNLADFIQDDASIISQAIHSTGSIALNITFKRAENDKHSIAVSIDTLPENSEKPTLP